jgi:hypothetical protein
LPGRARRNRAPELATSLGIPAKVQAFAEEIDHFSEIDVKVHFFSLVPGRIGLMWKKKLHFRRIFQKSLLFRMKLLQICRNFDRVACGAG